MRQSSDASEGRGGGRPVHMRQAVAEAARTLAAAGVASPEVDARLLAAHLLGVAPLEVGFADYDDAFGEAYAAAVHRRAAREPVQHITGSAPFGALDLEVGPGVFIPRPETEMLAQWAVGKLGAAAPATPTVVDLGTGSGALAISVAAACPRARVLAVERSATARGYAARNAATCGADVEIVAGDMTDPQLLRELDGAVDLVVTNPPYVPETPDLAPEVYRDPPEAVFSGADGMDAIRGLVPVAARLLAPGGWLGIEHDETTADAVRSILLHDATFTDVETLTDLTGRPRFATASKVIR